MSNAIQFGLRKIATLQFATFDTTEIVDNAINLNFAFGFGISAVNRLLAVSGKFEFLSNEKPFIGLDVSCEFEIEANTWNSFIDHENNTIVFPLAFVTQLATLTVGTARGVLHAKTENTKYNNYFLPTLNITESIKTDISIGLAQ